MWQGLLAVAPLLGIPAITLLCVAQFFVTGPVQLMVLRVLLGIAMGADYPIASSLLSEFAPRKSRARLIGLQNG